MTTPVSKEQAACELGHSVNKGLKLVIEGYEWILKRKRELIRQLEEHSISKTELDEEMAEIKLLEQQLKAFSEQLEASEKEVEKVLEKDENDD